MDNLIFFDTDFRTQFYPFTYTRPLADLRFGILKISEKWSLHTGISSISYLAEDYLSELFPLRFSDKNLLINSRIIPSTQLKERINSLELNQAVLLDGELIAAYINDDNIHLIMEGKDFPALEGYEADCEVQRLESPLDFVIENKAAIFADYDLLSSSHKTKAPKADQARIIRSELLYCGTDVEINAANINCEEGPVYLGDGVEILEGANLRGPLVIQHHSVVKMGACIYPGTTVGAHCAVSGEIKNSIIQDYTNKGHEGYLGDSMIGSWCNLGAGTYVSNLKNTLGHVQLYDMAEKSYRDTLLQKCGTFMGDFVRTGIQTSFTAGTVIGPVCNIYGTGFQPSIIDGFSWGDKEFEPFLLDKAVEICREAMSLKGVEATKPEEKLFRELHHLYFSS